MGLSARVLGIGLLVAAAGAFAAPPGGSHGGGVHVASGFSHGIPAPRNYPRTIGLQPSFGFTGINPGALRTRGVYGRGYNRLPVGYFFAPYYYPSLGYDSYGYDNGGYDAAAASGPDPVAQGLMEGQDALGQQVAELQQQVASLSQGYPQYPQQPTYAPSQASSAPAPPPQPPVTLVLRSGQQLRVQNFAVMDQTFWDFSSQPTRKIPLNAIDIPASTQATAAAGGEFPTLSGGE